MIGLLLLIVTNYLAGFSLYRIVFRSTNIIEKIVVPQALSLIITPALFVMFYFAFGFDAALILVPLSEVCFFVVSLRIKQKTDPIRIERKWVAVAASIAAISILMSPTIINMTGFSLFADPSLHVSIANFIKDSKTMPPDNPCLYGVKLNYQWFYHLLISAISIYSDVGVLSLMPYFTVYLMIVFLAAMFLLGHRIFDSALLGICLMVVMFVFFSEYFLVPQTQGYALILVAMFFYSFYRFAKEGADSFGLLTGIIAAGMMYIHALSFIFMGMAILSFIAYRIIFIFDKKAFRQFVLLLSPLILTVPYFILIQGFAGTAFMFEPLGGMVFNYPQLFGFILIVLPFGIWHVLKTRGTHESTSLILLTILFAFVNTLLMGKSHDILRFVLFMIFPIAFISFDRLKASRDVVKYLGLAAVIASLVFLQFGKFSYYLSNSFVNSFSGTDEYELSQWIRSNTAKSDVILTSPLVQYTAISERRILICEPFYASGQLYDPTETVVDLSRLYMAPTQDLVAKYNITYVVSGDREVGFFGQFDIQVYDFSNSTAFSEVHRSGNFTVYKVTDALSLPEHTAVSAESMRQMMIDAYPARWLAF